MIIGSFHTNIYLIYSHLKILYINSKYVMGLHHSSNQKIHSNVIQGIDRRFMNYTLGIFKSFARDKLLLI